MILKKKSKRKNNDAWWWWLDSICDSNLRSLIYIPMCIHKILQFKKSSCKVKSFLASNLIWYCPHVILTGQSKLCSNANPPWPLNSLSKKHRDNLKLKPDYSRKKIEKPCLYSACYKNLTSWINLALLTSQKNFFNMSFSKAKFFL